MNSDYLERALKTLRAGEGASLRIGFAEHKDRPTLIDEAHARPAARIASPSVVTRITMLSRGEGRDDFAHLGRLCEFADAGQPIPDARHFQIGNEDWSLVWERHTELTTYTVCEMASSDPDRESAVHGAPLRELLRQAPGEAVAASRIVIVGEQGDLQPESLIREAFGE